MNYIVTNTNHSLILSDLKLIIHLISKLAIIHFILNYRE